MARMRSPVTKEKVASSVVVGFSGILVEVSFSPPMTFMEEISAHRLSLPLFNFLN
jgi:hypothetical protein